MESLAKYSMDLGIRRMQKGSERAQKNSRKLKGSKYAERFEVSQQCKKV